jgi:hypothetical protein
MCVFWGWEKSRVCGQSCTSVAPNQHDGHTNPGRTVVVGAAVVGALAVVGCCVGFSVGEACLGQIGKRGGGLSEGGKGGGNH